jgi:signal transduction histidine kinase
VRLGIRAKQIAGVTSIVAVTIVALSALYVTQLASAVLGENQKLAQTFAKQIFQRSFDIVAEASDPYGAIRSDPGLRSILQSTLYGNVLLGAAVVDTNGLVLASDDPARIGETLPVRPQLTALVESGPIEQLREIYAGDGRTFEYRETMVDTSQGSNRPFGAVSIAVSTVFVRNAISDLLLRALVTGGVVLLVAVIVAGLLSQLLLRPIHVIRSGLTRLGKGEFGVTLDLPPGDEFGELGSYFNTVSQQLSADRSLLAGQKAHLQFAVENLEDAVALFDPTGKLLFSNPAMQPTLPAEAIGRALHGLLPNSHPYRTLVEETLASRLSRGPVQVKNAAADNGRPEGADHGRPEGEDELLAMTHAVSGTNGELVGVLLVARNLAHISRMQSTVAYSRKLVALGRLTAGIAHEVKNPLNAMMIHLELLRTKIRNGALAAPRVAETVAVGSTLAGVSAGPAPPLPASAQGALEHVEVIESEIRRLDEVVQGFLKFARPEDLRLQPVRLASVFNEILPVVEPEATKNNVRVTVECPPNAPNVNGDASMLRQAFLNLAINACQAMPSGGTLRMTCLLASPKKVEVRFEDSGVGIAPENLEKIFDLYFTTKHHGTGIGLSMVYRIVQLHDGEIEVSSTPGHGTVFRVLLPRAFER